LLFVCLICVLILPQDGFAIGQMTEPIVFNDILRGQEVFSELKFVNSKAKDVIYQLKAEGHIADWTSFYGIEDKEFENPINKIEIPSKFTVSALVNFRVPQDTPNGEYKGVVAVIFAPELDEETGMKVSVKQRVDRTVSITVTDEEIIDFEAITFPVEHDLGKNKPLEIKVSYENKGNISVKPDIELKILKNGNSIFNAIFPYPETEEPVRPKKSKALPFIEWQTIGQESGSYKAEVKILLDNEILEEHSFTFHVSDSADEFLGFVAKIGGGNLTLSWFIIGIFFLIIGGILFFINKRRKRNIDNI